MKDVHHVDTPFNLFDTPFYFKTPYILSRRLSHTSCTVFFQHSLGAVNLNDLLLIRRKRKTISSASNVIAEFKSLFLSTNSNYSPLRCICLVDTGSVRPNFLP